MAQPAATTYINGYIGIHRSCDTSPTALILPEYISADQVINPESRKHINWVIISTNPWARSLNRPTTRSTLTWPFIISVWAREKKDQDHQHELSKLNRAQNGFAKNLS